MDAEGSKAASAMNAKRSGGADIMDTEKKRTAGAVGVGRRGCMRSNW